MEWQNVWAECMNRTLLEVVRSMLSGAKLPHTHFGQKHCQRQLTYRTGVLPKLSKEWHHMKPGRERNLQLIICEHSPMCMYQRMKERSSTQSQKDAFCWAMEQGKKVIGCTISRNRRFFQQRCCFNEHEYAFEKNVLDLVELPKDRKAVGSKFSKQRSKLIDL